MSIDMSRCGWAGRQFRSLATVAVVLLVACDSGGGPVTPETDGVFPIFRSITDGSSGCVTNVVAEVCNDDFWWLSPTALNPSGEFEFDKLEFNNALFPLIDIWKVAADAGGGLHGFAAIEPPVVIGGAASLQGNHYQFKYRTDKGAGDMVYLVTARIGATVLGTVHLVLGNKGGKTSVNLEVGDYLVNAGGQAVFKFSIENDALCIARDPDFDQATDECFSASVDLDDGGRVGPESSTVTVEEGTTTEGGGESATFTFEDCDAVFPLANPEFGECFRIVVEEGDFDFSKAVIVSDCGVDESIGEPFHDHTRLFQFTAAEAQALPKAVPQCEETTGALDRPSSWIGRLASTVAGLLGPRPLRASATLIDNGGGGEVINFRSNFVISVPAQMTLNGGDGLDALVGTATAEPPTVLVKWLETTGDVVGSPGGPLAGASITFGDITGGGSISGVNPYVSDSDGIAGPATWTVGGLAGTNTVAASAFGISSPPDNAFYQGKSLPFEITEPPHVGTITFTAEGLAFAQQDGGPVIPIKMVGDGSKTVGEFYGYGTLAGSLASSNTGLEIEDTSIIFIYDGSDYDGLVMIHDRASPFITGGCATFDFLGTTGLSFAIKDDPGDGYTESPDPTQAVWRWNLRNTDGAAIDLTRGTPEAIVVDPTFPPAGPLCGLTPGTITAWTLLRGGGLPPVDLVLTAPLTIIGR